MHSSAAAMRYRGLLGLVIGAPAAIPGVTAPPMSRLADTTTARRMTDPDRTAFLTPRPPFVSGAFADWLRRSVQESRSTRFSRLAGGCFCPSADVTSSGLFSPRVLE